MIVFESVKKRLSGIHRPAPVQPDFLDTLNLVHNVQAVKKRKDRGSGVYLLDWSRGTAWARVCEGMDAPPASLRACNPQGISHGYGIGASLARLVACTHIHDQPLKEMAMEFSRAAAVAAVLLILGAVEPAYAQQEEQQE